MRRLAAAALLAASFLPGLPARGAAASAEAGKVPLSEWYRGPVRYLIKRREEKEFKALHSDAERILFIRDFWRDRDPNPATPENEARVAFWQRVAEANTMFRESARPGWLTDRGRIHILLGSPNDIQQDLNFRQPRNRDAPPGLVRWIYQGLVINGRQEANFVVAFVQDESAEWRLSDDAQLNSIFFDPFGAASTAEAARMFPRLQSALDAVTPSELSAAMDLGRLIAPPDETALIDTITTDTFYGVVPVSVRWDFYPGTGDGRTLAVATVYVARADIQPAGDSKPTPTLLALARLENAEGKRVEFGEGSFTGADEDGTARDPLLYQARALVPPGPWRFWAGVFDTVGLRSGRAAGTVEVPPFATDGIEISPLTPARTVAPVTRKVDVGWTLPFILGDLRVIPKNDTAFSRTGDFAVYFQIAALPASLASRRLELRFFRREADAWVPAGKPQIVQAPGAAQGWTVPLKDWPVGSYRLVVTLGASEELPEASRSLDFTVTD